MDVQLLIIILKIMLILCNSASTNEQKKAVVKTKFLGTNVKLNSFKNRNRGVTTHANIKNYLFYVETIKEYFDTKSTFYNESVSMKMRCYGTNLPSNHTLTWHVLIRGQEIATIRRNSDKPNNNITLYYDLGIYDNETRFYCSLESPGANDINTNDYFIPMIRNLDRDYLQIGLCNYSHGFIPAHMCHWKDDGIGFVRLKPANGKDVDCAEGFDYIAPEYYNSFYSTVTHSCADEDTALIKLPNGTVTINDSKSFSFTKSDNGTILFCVRLNFKMPERRNDGSTAITKVTRETYNERICLYNENVLLADKINSDIKIAIIILFVVIVVCVNAVGIISCVYRFVKKCGKKSQNRNTDNHNDVLLEHHRTGIWKKWRS